SEHAHELQEPCPRCEVCSAPVAIAATGRPRKYCSAKCRQKAVRMRGAIEALALLEILKSEFPQPAIDWSDEDHRVA
ncbi:hypothetical protein OH705_28255, partial [Pseudomonas sp. BJa3]